MKRVFSGIQPTGVIHIGNYLGALKNWVKLQDEYECIYCIVDQHAMTVSQDPRELKDSILYTAKILLALGIDPQKSIFFVQSDVPEHTELAWILNCYTYFGELRRMTQFKEKTGNNQEASGVGLFTYPVLMASDILLYQTDMVPVGEDQKQHLELTRTIARRINNLYGEVFNVPEPVINALGARIMGLDDPKSKMSKSSSSEYSYIALTDTPENISRKIQFAVTDSGKEVILDEDKKPAVSNLLTIYNMFSDIPISELVTKYKDQGYAGFKKDLAEVVIKGLEPIQKNISRFQNDDDNIRKILSEGAQKAKRIASATLRQIKDKIGMGV